MLQINSLISVLVAAKRFNVNQSTLYYWINGGRLKYLQLGATKYVLPYDVEEAINTAPYSGRKKKNKPLEDAEVRLRNRHK